MGFQKIFKRYASKDCMDDPQANIPNPAGALN
jgi:hypothetical protein